MGKKVLLTFAAALIAAPIMLSGVARAASPTPTPHPSPALQGVFQNTYYANVDSDDPEDTVRIVNDSGGSLCALIYVTDQDQEMRECCGCFLSHGGTRTLSVDSDLTDNPANGVATSTGSIAILSSASAACNPSAPKATPQLEAWSTHAQSLTEVTEEEFTPLPLSSAAQANLIAQCAAIQLIGSGKGICSCGTGD